MSNLTLAAFAYSFCLLIGGCGSELQSNETSSARVVIGKVSPAMHERELTYLGRTRSESFSTLSFEIGGLIKEMAVDIGDTVQQGDLLARLDTQIATLQLIQAEADFERAEFEVQNASTELARRKKLIGRDLVSPSAVEQWALRLTGAQAQLQVANAARDLAQKQVADTHLRAPYSGIITARHVQAKQNVQQGQPIVDVVKADDVVEVTVFIPEKYASSERLSHNATIQTSRHGNLKGMIKDISGQANRYGLVEVLLTVDNATTATIKPGIPVDVAFSLNVAHEGTEVPVSAIVSAPDDSALSIWRVDPKDNSVSRVPVSVISIRDSAATVRGDLKSGDSIVVQGGTGLRGGQRVSVNSY